MGKAKPSVKMSLADFIKEVNTSFGGNFATQGTALTQIANVKRMSSKILGLDLALGGGWPLGRISLVAGEYSTGKTEIAIQAAISVQEHDSVTKLHRLRVPAAGFRPGRCLWVDAESAFDPAWAASKGFDVNHHVYARPDTGEQCVDLIARAIDEDLFDLIVLDSLAQMTPSVEVSESAEDLQMGAAARLNNKAFRRWNSIMSGRSRMGKPAPAFIVLNQLRLKIGVMFGDPRTLPGGKGQEYCSSIIVYTKSAKYEKGPASEDAEVELGGAVTKNKTFQPKQNYSFTMGLAASSKMGKGVIDNMTPLIKYAKEGKWLAKVGGSYQLFGAGSYPTEEAVAAALEADPMAKLKLWRSIVHHFTGYQ